MGPQAPENQHAFQERNGARRLIFREAALLSEQPAVVNQNAVTVIQVRGDPELSRGGSREDSRNIWLPPSYPCSPFPWYQSPGIVFWPPTCASKRLHELGVEAAHAVYAVVWGDLREGSQRETDRGHPAFSALLPFLQFPA